jgi:hypothetical protein
MVSAQTTLHAESDCAHEHAKDDGCPCGCAECPEGCRLECLERPRYFCGQLLTDSDLTALVEWTRARLALVRHRHGWGVVCGLEVRCDPRTRSKVEIGEGYAVSCCGSDIVVCTPAVVDLSKACHASKSPCDDPCAPEPERSEETEGRGDRNPWDCPEGVWVDILIDAADEEASGRPTLSTDGCTRIGSCEASRVRETHSLKLIAPSAGDPLARAERRWAKEWARCFIALEQSGVPDDDTTYGELRLAVERFALDQGCERGGCRALRWICAPDAPADDSPVYNAVVQDVRLALLLDCLVAIGRCDCQTCQPGTAVPLARVLVVPGASQDCPCTVVAVDDAPPYRRALGHDCPPAGLGRVNLADLLGQDPHGACLEVLRRGIEVEQIDERDATTALQVLDPKNPPVFHCNETVRILTVVDECLGPRVVGFTSGRAARFTDSSFVAVEGGEILHDPDRPVPHHPLLRLEGITERRVELLADRGITSLGEFSTATGAALRGIFPGTRREDIQRMQRRARRLAREEEA